MRTLMLPIAAITLLASCGDISLPAAAISPKGQILRGSSTAHSSGQGTFQIGDGRITCAGTYDALSMSPTISFPVQCSNGLKGLGTAIRESDGMGGSGTVRMNDGSDWRFVFGKAAAAF